MKRLWNKLRKWLIRKLGGMEKAESAFFCVTPVSAEIDFPFQKLPYNIGKEAEDNIKLHIATELGMRLWEEGMIQFEVGRKFKEEKILVRGTVRVFNAEQKLDELTSLYGGLRQVF